MAEDNNNTSPAPATPTDSGKSIPYDRFQSVVSERNNLKTAMADLENQLQGAMEKAATVDTLASTIEQMKADHTAAAEGWKTDQALMGAGLLDAEGRDVAKYLYGRLTGDDKPALPDWLSSLQADPAAAPKALAPYLTSTAKQDAPAAAPTQTMPRSNNGTNSTVTPTTGAPISAERIRQLRMDAMRTGDWTAYRESRSAILASVKGKG